MAFTKINAAGIGSTELVTLHSLEVLNNATVGGVLTYEDVTNVDSIGLITARNGIVVGSGITLSKDGDGFFTGVTTATTFVGSTGTFSSGVRIENTNYSAQAAGNELIVGTTTGDNGITIASASSGTGNIYFGDGDSNSIGYIRYVHNDNFLKFNVNGSEKFRIASDGHVAIGGYGDPASILDIREEQDGAETKIRLFNTDNDNTTTQTAALYLSPDSRATALTGLRSIKENADMSTSASRDVSLTLNTLQNNSQVEALRIDSSGRVLIGTTTEGQADADNLTIADSGSCGITLRSGTSAAGAIYFSDATSGAAEYDGAVIYNQSSQYMDFYTAQSQRLRIQSGGIVSIPNGIELGSGIDGTAANTLDDYEEGSFTPTISDGSGNNSTFGAITSAKYTKIGDTVRASFRAVNVQTSGLTGSDVFYVKGLPFTTTGRNYNLAFIRSWNASNWSAAQSVVAAFVESDQVSFYGDDGSTTGGVVLKVEDMINNQTDIFMTMLYQTTE